MKPTTLQEIYMGKRERRKQLASLPINERVQIIEKLHEFGLMMRNAKADLRQRENQSSIALHKNR